MCERRSMSWILLSAIARFVATAFVDTPFIHGQVIATLGAKTVSFAIKSVLAYRDRRLCELRSLWP